VDYIGIDPAVGLECSACKEISRLPYSALLERVTGAHEIECSGCGRSMRHDWTTISVVQNIIRKRMRQAVEAKTRQYRLDSVR
jgi:hypothetical protein